MRTSVHPFSDVSLLRPEGELLDVLRKGVDSMGGIARYVKPGDTVFIKPNLTAGMPASTGGTTDVLFTEAVVRLVKEAQPGRILVGECSGNESRSIESLTNCGYVDMGRRQGVEVVDLDFAEFEDISIDHPLYRDVVHLPKVLMEADVFISVPVLKNHVSVGITVALKNSFGLVPDDDKLTAHRNNAVEEILVDISKARRPDLVFVDGRLGAEGIAGGTHFKKPIAANLVLVGNDPVAIDAVSARVMDQNPRERYIQWAAMEGLGYDNLDYIRLHGLTIEEAKIHFLTPAEEIMQDSLGKVRLCDLESCSKCRGHGGRRHEPLFRNARLLIGAGGRRLRPGRMEKAKLHQSAHAPVGRLHPGKIPRAGPLDSRLPRGCGGLYEGHVGLQHRLHQVHGCRQGRHGRIHPGAAKGHPRIGRQPHHFPRGRQPGRCGRPAAGHRRLPGGLLPQPCAQRPQDLRRGFR